MPGYDSIYVQPSDTEDKFRHEYILFDGSQILPMFLVQFELDPTREDSLSIPLCDICGESQSVWYCEADDANLCHDCDDEHHNKGSKLSQKHKRVPVTSKPKKFGNCIHHPDIPIEFYCNVCHDPV